jgi:hypothetical protein
MKILKMHISCNFKNCLSLISRPLRIKSTHNYMFKKSLFQKPGLVVAT